MPGCVMHHFDMLEIYWEYLLLLTPDLSQYLYFAIRIRSKILCFIQLQPLSYLTIGSATKVS